jgi:hypothetical protein
MKFAPPCINVMGHMMDPYWMKNIVVMIDLFFNTNMCALKHINTIYLKENELIGILVSWQTTTYH